MNNMINKLSAEELKEVTGGNNDNTMTEGIAGAYGGSDDSGKTTVTGETVDDSSMGVAIPVSWPNYRSYFGRKILINYCGMTVHATINDAGVLSGRNLDLQPGIFRSFGCNSCADWGVRTISYCIL